MNITEQIQFALNELNFFSDIKFTEETHSYVNELENYKFPISVTGFIHKFYPPYQEKYWAGVKAIEYGITEAEVLKMWEDKRNESTDEIGSPIHKYLEHIYTGCEYKIPTNENALKLIPVADKFYKKNKDVLIPVKSEVCVGHKDLELVGTFDQLFFNSTTKLFELWDWKTSQFIKKESFRNQKMFFPFVELNNSNYYHYSIQLNVYKYIIEKYTNLKISKCRILHLSYMNEDYTVYNCIDLQDRLDYYFKNMHNK